MTSRTFVALLLAVPLSFLWARFWRQVDAVLEQRRTCVHTWGPPKKVTIGWKVWCTKCAEQEFCHPDATLCVAPCEHCGRGKL